MSGHQNTGHPITISIPERNLGTSCCEEGICTQAEQQLVFLKGILSHREDRETDRQAHSVALAGLELAILRHLSAAIAGMHHHA